MTKDNNNRPTVSPELEAELERLDEQSWETAKGGDARASLEILETMWNLLPQPAPQWDYWPDTMSRTGVETCRDGRLFTEAEVWLERMRQVFSQGAGDPAILKLEAEVAFERGDADAVARLQMILTSYGPRTFGDDDPKYLESARTGQRVETTSAQGPVSGPPPERADWRDAVEELSEVAGDLLDEDWEQALATWQRALALVPQPQLEHEEAGWLYVSIGDAHHSGEQWAEAEAALQESMKTPGGTGRGYAWLRLGQCQYEQGNQDQAVQSLLSAYMLEGREIFADEGPEYFALLTERDLVDEKG